MISTLLGVKKGMTSVYDARGRRVGATVLEVTPNFVTQIKTEESKDGYNSVQIGTGDKKSVKKPQQGHFKKAGVKENLKWLKEVKYDGADDVTLGKEVTVSEVFKAGDSVKVSGTSKGKGFQGTVRRHGFHGGPKTHGQSDRHRAPGSIGSGTTPGRVYKGKKMSGHMGVDRVSYTGLEVIAVDKASNLITIKGGIPGPIGGLVMIEKTGVIKGYTPPPEPEVEVEELEAVEAVSEASENTSEVSLGETAENHLGGEAEAAPVAEETTEVIPADEVQAEPVVEAETEEPVTKKSASNEFSADEGETK
jgi:large subunit ribosomal protein L3